MRLVPSYDSGRQQVVITRNEEKADRAEEGDRDCGIKTVKFKVEGIEEIIHIALRGGSESHIPQNRASYPSLVG